jgi:hypothetical protein
MSANSTLTITLRDGELIVRGSDVELSVLETALKDAREFHSKQSACPSLADGTALMVLVEPLPACERAECGRALPSFRHSRTPCTHWYLCPEHRQEHIKHCRSCQWTAWIALNAVHAITVEKWEGVEYLSLNPTQVDWVQTCLPQAACLPHPSADAWPAQVMRASVRNELMALYTPELAEEEAKIGGAA